MILRNLLFKRILRQVLLTLNCRIPDWTRLYRILPYGHISRPLCLWLEEGDYFRELLPAEDRPWTLSWQRILVEFRSSQES